MKSIDVVVPYSWSKIRKLPFFNSPYFDVIANRDWYPLVINLEKMLDYGYKFNFYSIKQLPRKFKSSCIIIDSRIKDGKSIYWDDVINIIRKLKKSEKTIVFFDNKDSHNLIIDLLPEVDFYFKKQLLKNKNIYKYKMDGGRLFTDFYSKVNDGINWDPFENNVKTESIISENVHKLKVSWNILMAIDKFNSLKDYYRLYRSDFANNKNYYSPTLLRNNIINANFNTEYSSELVSYQRVRMQEFLLTNKLVSGNHYGIVSKSQYDQNLRQSRAVVSPFGWGEVCYRDFEAFKSGAALIKPEVEHLETWPDLYKPNETYFPLSWDINDWAYQFEQICESKELITRVAENAQVMYKSLWNNNGRENFCKRFSTQLDEIIVN